MPVTDGLNCAQFCREMLHVLAASAIDFVQARMQKNKCRNGPDLMFITLMLLFVVRFGTQCRSRAESDNMILMMVLELCPDMKIEFHRQDRGSG
jgi:hypothetical protein